MSDTDRNDEISGGPSGAGPRTRTFWLVAVLVAAVVAGLAWQQRRAHDPEPAPRPSAAGRIILAQVCPVGSDRHRRLTVAFRLSSGFAAPVLLVSAEPVLPLGGLHPVLTAMTSGSCAQPLDTHADGSLAPGDAVMVIFQFEVPA